MAGPYIYSNVISLVGKPYVDDAAENYLGECVSLVKHYVPALQNRSTKVWVKGPNVIETLKDGGVIMTGTAIATFGNGSFSCHASFFAGYEKDTSGNFHIKIVDQYLGSRPFGGIILRILKNKGKDANGIYNDPSNNGEAFFVIL
jgi:hypothetical protein